MVWLGHLNLIHLFDFYLALAFLASTGMRLRQYEAVVHLVRAVPDRWPRLLRLVRGHHAIFLTWATVLPAVLALGLTLLHMMVSRLVWPHAAVTGKTLAEFWPALFLVAPSGLGMIGVDLYATFRVGQIDRSLMEQYFDQAEYWLRSWVAPVVHAFTLGYISPRRMVADEVRKALLEASRLLNTTLWWVSVQVSLRILYGLTLWLTWGWSVA